MTPARGQPIVQETAARAELASAASVASHAEGHDIADALERIAARVRAGAIDVPSGHDMSDEAALSAVLTALLRSRR